MHTALKDFFLLGYSPKQGEHFVGSGVWTSFESWRSSEGAVGRERRHGALVLRCFAVEPSFLGMVR
jgi:hypothetical protein